MICRLIASVETSIQMYAPLSARLGMNAKESILREKLRKVFHNTWKISAKLIYLDMCG